MKSWRNPSIRRVQRRLLSTKTLALKVVSPARVNKLLRDITRKDMDGGWTRYWFRNFLENSVQVSTHNGKTSKSSNSFFWNLKRTTLDWMGKNLFRSSCFHSLTESKQNRIYCFKLLNSTFISNLRAAVIKNFRFLRVLLSTCTISQQWRNNNCKGM